MLAWQELDAIGPAGATVNAVVACDRGCEFRVSDLPGIPGWVLAVTRVSDLDDRSGLPPTMRFPDMARAQAAAQLFADAI